MSWIVRSVPVVTLPQSGALAPARTFSPSPSGRLPWLNRWLVREPLFNGLLG
jgi:hypothetical protein